MSARLLPILLIAALTACGPKAPEGVDKARLDAEVGRAIGDPATCLLIAEPGGDVVYRYGTHTVCGRKLPACGTDAMRTVGDLVEEVAAGKAFTPASCRSLAADRGVAWAAGPVEGRPLVYAAVMEGSNIPPGIAIRDKVAAAFRRAGL